MSWRPYTTAHPARLQRDELDIALSLIRTNMSDLARLHAGIVRRGIAPGGWSENFMNSLLEMRCALQVLKEQIDGYWRDNGEDV
jgi:hypothetical protein